MKFKSKLITLFLSLSLFSCSPLHQIHLIQSDNRIKKTEDRNFNDEKVLTQWWYYDCIFEDGSVLVILFTPYQWWNAIEKMPHDHSLFYLSYMNAAGTVMTSQNIIDTSKVIYTNNSIKSPCFEIIRNHEKHSREYIVNFNLDSIKGSLKINSDEKAFSPFPRGSMSAVITKIFKPNVKGLSYRYSSHVPEGKVHCTIESKENKIELLGKVYHEQGWFTGSPDQMGAGWTWIHFVSKNMNIFGTTGQFIFVKKGENYIIGGLEKKYSLDEITYSDKQKNLVIGGKISFHSNNLLFTLNPTEKKSTTLICLPAFETNQLWGTVLQETIIKMKYKKNEFSEKGMMFIETCRMSGKD